MATYPITVQLIGQDGNAFGLIARVRKAISDHIGKDEAKAFADEAFDKGSYDELLAFIMDTVEVE